MAANNEIGVLQPLAEIGAIAHERGALLHTDAAQAAGKVPIDVDAIGVDLLSLTGAQVLRARRARARCTCAGASRSSQLACQIDGGGHENGLRSGTLNVPGIVGLGRARGDLPRGDAGRVARGSRRCAIGCSPACSASLDGVRVNGSLTTAACRTTCTSASTTSRARRC